MTNTERKQKKSLDGIRDEQGKLPAFAWPGGYPVIYITRDGDVICPDCANDDSVNQDQAPIAFDVFYEGSPQACADCGTPIESAYGDPETDD